MKKAGIRYVNISLSSKKYSKELMGTDLRGTNLIGLTKCAERLGFDCASGKVEREGFLSAYTKPYLLTNNKQNKIKVNKKIFTVVGSGLLILLIIYIVKRRKYWFW